jgi:hypothetical protein
MKSCVAHAPVSPRAIPVVAELVVRGAWDKGEILQNNPVVASASLPRCTHRRGSSVFRQDIETINSTISLFVP